MFGFVVIVILDIITMRERGGGGESHPSTNGD